MWSKKAFLAFTSATEVDLADFAEFALADELVKLLAVALRVAVLVVALPHGGDKVPVWLQSGVAVFHGLGRNVSLQEHAGGSHEVEPACEILGEVVRAAAHPDAAPFLVGGRGVEHVDELLAGIKPDDFHFPCLRSLMQLESDQSRARSNVEHLRVGAARLTDEASDLVNNEVRLVEVHAARPLVVPFSSDSIVKLANVFVGGIVNGELLDRFVANRGHLPYALVLISHCSLRSLLVLTHHVEHNTKCEATRSKHEWQR